MKEQENRGQGNNKLWVIPLIIVVSVVAVFSIDKISFGGAADNDPLEPEKELTILSNWVP